MNQRPRMRRLFLSLILSLSLLVAVLFPTLRYKPSCGEWRDIHFAGPMRAVYVDYLEDLLTQYDFIYVRIGNRIFFNALDYLYPLGLAPLRISLHNFLINYEWRIAANISYGYGSGGSRIEPPPVLIELVKKHNVFLRHRPPEEWSGSGYSSGIFYKCEIIRAAAIRIEDMRPEDLPDLPD